MKGVELSYDWRAGSSQFRLLHSKFCISFPHSTSRIWIESMIFSPMITFVTTTSHVLASTQSLRFK